MQVRTHKICLRGLSREQYRFLRKLCYKSRALYNSALFILNQHYEKTGEYIGYFEMCKMMKNHDAYKTISTEIGGQILKILDQDYKSFFALLKLKQSGQYNEFIRPPFYKPKNSLFILPICIRSRHHGNHIGINVPKAWQKHYSFKRLTIPRPHYNSDKQLKQVIILPKGGLPPSLTVENLNPSTDSIIRKLHN